MQTATRSPEWTRHLMTLIGGLVAALAIWLVAGAPDMAWLGFLLAALTAETRGRRACVPRAPRPGRG